MNNQLIKDGHQNRLREEIVAYLDDYFEESGAERPVDIESYIQEQTTTVLERMYAEDEDPRPEDEDPETVMGDYYRESIADYGTVYTDYNIDDIEFREDDENVIAIHQFMNQVFPDENVRDYISKLASSFLE